MSGLEYIAEPLRPFAVPVETLTLDPNNAKEHPERNIEAIAASLKRFGQRAPIVVQRDGMVVRAGNGRLIAARSLGWTHVAAIVVNDTEVEAVAYAIADNRTAELAEWSDAKLSELLKSLPQDVRCDVGFTDADMRELIRSLEDGAVVEDTAPPMLPSPISRLGDLWLMGGHRLLCGDTTRAEDVQYVLGEETPVLMVTDPPYGVDYDPNWRNEKAKKGNLAYALRRVRKVANDDRADWTDVWKLSPCDVFYCWHGDRHGSTIQRSIEAAGFEVRNQIIWAKSNFPISRGHYHSQHELCWYAVRRGRTSKWTGDRKQTTLWKINLDKNCGGHSTQKPVECMARPIRNHDASIVYDPFLGSGTTLSAAEQLARRCFAIEIEPVFVDVAVRRWQNLTGKEAVLEGDGRTFGEIERERLGANAGTGETPQRGAGAVEQDAA